VTDIAATLRNIDRVRKIADGLDRLSLATVGVPCLDARHLRALAAALDAVQQDVRVEYHAFVNDPEEGESRAGGTWKPGEEEEMWWWYERATAKWGPKGATYRIERVTTFTVREHLTRPPVAGTTTTEG